MIPYSQPMRVNRLNPRQPTELTLAPDAATRAAIAAALGLLDLPEARMTARLMPEGADAWSLSGQLTARVVQPCVVTLDPVETRIDEPVLRRWSPHLAAAEGDEIEIPADDTEPLGQTIDPAEVMVEALALALPLYPRAPGAVLPAEGDAGDGAGAGDGTGDGDDTRRPFAGLAAMLDRRGRE